MNYESKTSQHRKPIWFCWWIPPSKEELMKILLKLLPKKNWRGGDIPKLIYKVPLPWYQSKKGYFKKRELQAIIPNEDRCKEFQKNISKLNLAEWNDNLPWSREIYPWTQGGSTYANQSTCYTTLIEWKIQIIWSIQQM